MLSGGERVRLALAKIFKRRPNFLILDEPTNHMDIVGKETLESMLKDYPGTVIFVSHDRYFIKQVSDVLLVMSPADDAGQDSMGEYKVYQFGYEQYMEEVESAERGELNNSEGVGSSRSTGTGKTSVVSPGRSDGKQENPAVGQPVTSGKYYNPGKEQAKLERKIKKIEEQLETCEAEIQKQKEELQNPELASDYVRLQEIQSSIDNGEEQLLQLMSEWDELQSLITK